MVSKETIDKVIKVVGDSGGTGNVFPALGYPPEQFDDAFLIANEIQNMDFVKLLYSNFNQQKIVVEFTLLGWSHYRGLVH